MTKRIISILLSLILILTYLSVCLPVSATDNTSKFINTFFKDNKIEAPSSVPYFKYNKEYDRCESLEMFYDVPSDIVNLYLKAEEVAEQYDSLGVGFCELYNIYSYETGIQIDIKVDDNEWQSTNGNWDEFDYGDNAYYNLNSILQENINSSNKRNVTTQGWLVYYTEEPEGIDYLKPVITSSIDEYGETVYHYDLTNHTISFRYRTYLEYIELDSEEDYTRMFSDWSPETSIGKNGTQKTLSEPTVIPVPQVSSLKRIYDYTSQSFYCSFDLDIQQDLYDYEMYYNIYEDYGEPYIFIPEARINDGEWEEVSVGNASWLINGFRSFECDTVISADTKVEFRARWYNSFTYRYSDYSKTLILIAYPKGDLNRDGKINAQDDNLLTQAVLGMLPSAEYIDVGDLNGDYKITAIDSNRIAKLITG